MSWHTERRKGLRYVGIGTEFFLTFALLVVGGLMLDLRLKSLPSFTILGAAIGFTVGLYRLVKQGREILRQDRRGREGDQLPADRDDQ